MFRGVILMGPMQLAITWSLALYSMEGSPGRCFLYDVIANSKEPFS